MSKALPSPRKLKPEIEVSVVPSSKVKVRPSPKLTLRYANVHNYSDLPEITLQQVEHFFAHYKDLEPGKWVKIGGWHDAAYAKKMIVEAIERAKNAK